MARRYFGSRYQPPQRKLDKANSKLDDILADAEGVLNGLQRLLPDSFDREAEAIEANEDLSEIGKRRALQKLVERYERHENFKLLYDPWLKRAESEAQRLEAVISQRPKLEGDHPERYAHELRHHRRMLDFRQLAPDERRAKVREALDKAVTSEAARALLWGLIDDDLLDGQSEQRARVALRSGGDPEAARALTELVGATDYTGRLDMARPGPLTIARFAKDSFLRYIRERAGVDPTLETLARDRGYPVPEVTGDRIVLSRRAASDAELFRLARSQAESQGLTLEVEELTHLTPASGNGNNGGSDGSDGGESE